MHSYDMYQIHGEEVEMHCSKFEGRAISKSESHLFLAIEILHCLMETGKARKKQEDMIFNHLF